ncbi:hypothetical protein GCM10027051_16160 [Niabella terrae]
MKPSEYPKEIQDLIIKRQVEAGNKADIKVFDRNSDAGPYSDGFDWVDTPEGYSFWKDVMDNSNFQPYYEKYEQPEFTLPEQPEFTLPEKWCVKMDKQEVVNYCNKYGKKPPYLIDSICLAHFPSWNGEFTTSRRIKPGYTKITFEQFKKYVLMEKQNKDRVITWSQAQNIIAAACNSWKPRLIDMWCYDIALKKDIQISDSFYKKMRNACTPDQHMLFDEIFGREQLECPYKEGELIFVKSTTLREWMLRYANGEINPDGCVKVYYDQAKAGNTNTYKDHAPAPGVKLPE